MVTVIALLLGLAVVALQLSSTQFSPRLLRNFLRDRPNQIVLSVFVGTFAYSAGGLFEVGVSGGQRSDEFPRFAVTVAVALLFVSLALLVYFADHLAHSIQVDHIMRVVERSTLPVIRRPAHRPSRTVRRASCRRCRPRRCPSRPGRRDTCSRAPRAAARRGRGAAGATCGCGRGSASTSSPARRWPGSGRPPRSSRLRRRTRSARAWHAAVRIGFERTLEQDPGLGLRQLVDPACKALSPAVNDPYTAIQAIEHLSVLFAALAARPLGPIVAHDPTAGVTVAVPARSFAEHLALGVGLIRRYGAQEPTVIQALLRLLATVLDRLHRTRPLVGDRGPGRPPRRRGRTRGSRPADLAVVYAEADTLRRDAGRPPSRRPAQPRHPQWPTPVDTAAPDLARPASPVSAAWTWREPRRRSPRTHRRHISVRVVGPPSLLAGLVLAVQHLPQDA